MKENIVKNKSFAFAVRVVRLYPFLVEQKIAFVLSLAFFFLAICVSAQTSAELFSRIGKGDSVAMIQLADAYRFGRGVIKSEDSADYWVHKAALDGHPEGQFLEGLKFVKNIFSEKKFLEGIKWLSLAAENGNVNAMEKLATLYISNAPPGTSGSVFPKFRNPLKALLYGEMAAENNSQMGILFTAQLLMDAPKGLTADSIEATRLMEKLATEFNDPVAQLLLARWYFDRRVNGKREAFIAWYWVNLSFNNPKANYELGSEADIERYRIDQYLKRLHNANLHNCWFLKPTQGFLEYRTL